ncbi:hypothetical protein D3C80_1479080 [compost metagenome]
MDIVCQRALDTHGFAQAFIVDTALVNPLTALPQHAPKLTKTLEQHRQIAFLHVFTGAQPQVFQLGGGDFADTGYFTQRQGFQKMRNLIGRDHVLAVRFVEIRGDFGEKLYRRDTGRGGEIQFIRNGLADRLRH